MTMFSAAILAMQRESKFVKRLQRRQVKKTEYWDPMYEDCTNIVATHPR